MAFTKAGREDELEEISDISELDMDDRHELDDAVLELLGVIEPEGAAGGLGSAVQLSKGIL